MPVIVGAVEPVRQQSGTKSRSDRAILHPRFAAWYKLGDNYLQGNAASQEKAACSAALPRHHD
jgi:hypothetical protein